MPMNRTALIIALCAFTSASVAAQTASSNNRYVFLGNAQRVDRTPSGVVIHADNGTVAVEAIAGVGQRIRVRFGDSNATFPAIHSLATGDSAPRLGAATIGQEGDAIVVSGEGVVARVAQHPVRISFADASGKPLVAESFGAGTWQGHVTHIVNDPAGVRYYGLGEQPVPLIRNGSVYP